MKGISVLIFSKDNTTNAISLINDVYDFVDEVILIDSSKKNERIRLSRFKNQHKLDRLRIFYTVPLGMMEVYRMYGISKCRYDWVLNFVTDERLSDALKKDLKKLVNKTYCDAFAIRRNENVYKHGQETGAFTWQVRLSKKTKTLYRGLLHEQPIISGKTCRLTEKQYYMEHREDLGQKSGTEYSKIEKFSRLSYRMYNMRILDYASKPFMPERSYISSTILGKVILALLYLYEAVLFRNPESEISNFDYRMLVIIRHAGLALKLHDFRNAFGIVLRSKKSIWWVKRAKHAPDSADAFAISKLIDKIGIIKFMKLDKESTMQSLNKKYMDRKGGINLLIDLMMAQYRRRYKNTDTNE